MPTNERFKTADLALVAVLLLFLPESLEAIDRVNPQKVLFTFRNGAELDSLTKKYWSRELRVEPQAYAQQMKQVKVRIYNEDPL